MEMKKLALLAMMCAALSFSVSAFAYEAENVANGGTITGTVKYKGTPPKPKKIEITKDKDVCGLKPHFDQDIVVGKDDGIQYAVVTLAIQKGAALKPEKEVTFDQKGCQYEPHVLAFPAGSTVQIVNSDGILHNIHTYSTKNPPFNMAQPKFKKVIHVTEKEPELVKVTCDAHGWMSGWWYVAGDPYYAVTDENGNFTIKDVPPGDYTIEAWQEKLAPAGKEVKQKVSVKAGQTSTVNFEMK
jgi:plastocyanin